MVRRVLALGALALFWGGCALTPDYERPETGLPEEWEEPVNPGESFANLPWWEIYRDPVLRNLIEIALAENQDLAAALARLEEARYQLTFVRADQFPFLDVFGTAERGRVPGLGTDDTFSVGAQLSFEIDLWRRYSRATEAARADLLAAEATHRSIMLTLVADVAGTYFLLRDLDQRRQISLRTTESRQESLGIIRARFREGTVPELDVNQAEVELAIAETSALGFERSAVQTRNALLSLLGRYPVEIDRGHALEDQTLPPEVPAGLPSDLLQRRPDVVAAEQALAAEVARIGVAQALRFPSLSLTANFGTVAGELHDLNLSNSKAWNAAGGLLQPIFRAGQLKAQVEAQRARAEQALQGYQATLRQAFREVEDALVGLRTLRLEHAARVKQVEAARNAARLSRARYDAGIVDYLEVLTSERTLFQSELDESATLQALLSATVDLYKALGGGWTAEDEDADTAP